MSEALIGALVALIDSRIAAHGGGQQVQQTQHTTPQAHDPFAGLGGTPAVQHQVTPEMVQSLIVPLVSNEATKQRLAAEMHAMGIQNLGDATAAQLPELYQRFQRVANEANGQAAGGLTGGGAATGGII